MTFTLIIALLMLAALIWGAGTLTPDTTSTTITGRDGTANWTHDDGTTILEYKCILDMFRIREVNEMTNADTFCIEGRADQEPGRSQLVFEIAGLGKKNGPSSGPMIPAPQNVVVKATFSTGCLITFSANFTEAEATRVVNSNMRISARGLSKGTYVVTWDIA